MTTVEEQTENFEELLNSTLSQGSAIEGVVTNGRVVAVEG